MGSRYLSHALSNTQARDARAVIGTSDAPLCRAARIAPGLRGATQMVFRSPIFSRGLDGDSSHSRSAPVAAAPGLTDTDRVLLSETFRLAAELQGQEDVLPRGLVLEQLEG